MVLASTLVVFLLINLVAYYPSESPAANSDGLWDRVLPPATPAGAAILQRVFGTTTGDAALLRARSAPNFEMHPVLSFITAPVSNKYYRVGVEGIRYDPGWDDATVRQFLASNEPLVFLFGGSTMFGHGVASDETISAYVNRSSTGKRGVVLNFGAEAYDQHREIEKLVYLLRSGYRPRQVVFLDGWNDIALVARSNMRWQDRVIFHGFSASRGEIAFTPGTRLRKVNYLRLFAESLPVIRWLRDWQQAAVDISRIRPARDAFVEGFDFHEADWAFRNWEAYAEKYRRTLIEDLITYYRRNLDFLQQMAEAFDFRLTVLLQPMGLFDKSNPFVPARAANTVGYQFLLEAWHELRREIAEGRLRMVDLSGALEVIQQDRYVDVAHYSPRANAVLAQILIEELKESRKNKQRRRVDVRPTAIERAAMRERVAPRSPSAADLESDYPATADLE